MTSAAVAASIAVAKERAAGHKGNEPMDDNSTPKTFLTELSSSDDEEAPSKSAAAPATAATFLRAAPTF